MILFVCTAAKYFRYVGTNMQAAISYKTTNAELQHIKPDELKHILRHMFEANKNSGHKVNGVFYVRCVL